MVATWLKSHRINLLILTLLIIITFINSLNNAFLSDDLAEIVNNPNINNLHYAIASHPFSFIRLIFYWFVFQIGNLNPFLFRSINILFHTCSVFLVFTIFSLHYSKRLAFFVAAIFAVHPAISEAIVWISGGGYPQYSFFFLLSLLFYFLSKRNKVYYWLAILAFLLSFMTHGAMPQALFLSFPLWELLYGDIRKGWIKIIPFFLISMFFLMLTFIQLPERVTTAQTVHYQQRGVDNPFIIIPVAITSYFELIFFPKTLTLYHSELFFSPMQFAIRFLITLIFFSGILISYKKNKFVFFWSSFFLIALAPTLTPLRLNWIVAERYLYLPIIGILALVGFGFDKLSRIPKLKQVTYTSFVVILILFSVRTIIRNIDWRSEDNLWIATGKTSPSSPNTHNNLGDLYGRQGDKQAALREFQKAIEIKPNYGDAYHNLANTYRELGQTDKALENYHKALEFNPNLWQSYQNIAALYYQAKDFNKSLEYAQKAIMVNPANINLRISLAVIYLSKGQKDKAKEIFNQVLLVDPQNKLAKQGLIEASK